MTKKDRQRDPTLENHPGVGRNHDMKSFLGMMELDIGESELRRFQTVWLTFSRKPLEMLAWCIQRLQAMGCESSLHCMVDQDIIGEDPSSRLCGLIPDGPVGSTETSYMMKVLPTVDLDIS